jgi:hypothetical protein
MKKESVTEFQEREIRVTNAWLGGARLYIDGECRDKNTKLLANPSAPSLSARFEHQIPDSPLAEVFAEAVVTVKARICVNGKRIAGDLPG